MKILLVEDEKDQREIVADILEANEHQVFQADSVESAIVQLKGFQPNSLPDVVFSDWKLGSLTGINLLDYIRQNQLNIGVVIATAYGSVQHAVKAIENGADDYLSKPFQSQELLLAISKANTANLLRTQNIDLSNQLSEQQSLLELVGNAPCMQQVYERIKRVSNTNATVLITGESGTGKELAARALYQLSDRNNQPFIAINCGAIPESLAEAELFGAEKGAFTGAVQQKIGKIEAANNGTLFLDEIGELPLLLQAKLLRFLQEGVITRLGSNNEIQLDVRIIAATHRDLPERIKQKEFREDLYYRLNVVPLKMPSLKERKEDIPSLLNHFMKKFQKQYGAQPVELSTTSKKALLAYDWPGNVRELSNKLERYVLLGDEQELLADIQPNTSSTSSPDTTSPLFTIPDQGLIWDEFESQCLKQALDKSSGNRSKAAKLLGISYKQFLYRLEKFNLN
ncbi:MAG: sigma-54-dependent Fis family transcriptional regulator [Gammaproteobacteria bacterium]|nr:sigma-54-dependent Fis family transcriptional regulator [Gammaproteobacteria bacterium]